MKRTCYILKYKNGRFVKRDDSTGPMSTGGYPDEVDTLEHATMWDTIEEAAKYGSMGGFRDLDECVYEVEITYKVSSPIPFPVLWERCDHHCLSNALSTARSAMHYADCTMFKAS